MKTATAPRILTDVPTGRPIKCWTVREAHKMFESGLLDSVKYELLEGQLVEKLAQSMNHGDIVMNVIEFLSPVFGITHLQTQRQIDIGQADEFSDPEPDVAVLRNPRRTYIGGFIIPSEDVLLAVEVGKSSLEDDLTRKARLYSLHGVREYWMADVESRALHVHRRPSPDGYEFVEILRVGQNISPIAAPDTVLSIADLLPETPQKFE